MGEVHRDDSQRFEAGERRPGVDGRVSFIENINTGK
jgi:hypothetical protein